MFIRLWCRANEEIQANYAQFLKFSISKVIIYVYKIQLPRSRLTYAFTKLLTFIL